MGTLAWYVTILLCLCSAIVWTKTDSHCWTLAAISIGSAAAVIGIALVLDCAVAIYYQCPVLDVFAYAVYGFIMCGSGYHVLNIVK